MVSSVNMMVSGIAASEPKNKNASRATPDIADVKNSEAIVHAAFKSDDAYSGPASSTAAVEQSQSSAGAKGEIRRVEIKDGHLTINVYDSSGKLLRKTPPGYLPAGEQNFDVTI
jgi:hypothetical protein